MILILDRKYGIIFGAEGGEIVREDKLGDLSMELSVEVLQLTKELHARHENIISNQIGRSATSICANIAESKYAHGPRTLLQSSKYRSKKPMKRANGLKCYGKADILTSRDTSGLTANVQQQGFYSLSPLPRRRTISNRRRKTGNERFSNRTYYNAL